LIRETSGDIYAQLQQHRRALSRTGVTMIIPQSGRRARDFSLIRYLHTRLNVRRPPPLSISGIARMRKLSNGRTKPSDSRLYNLLHTCCVAFSVRAGVYENRRRRTGRSSIADFLRETCHAAKSPSQEARGRLSTRSRGFELKFSKKQIYKNLEILLCENIFNFHGSSAFYGVLYF
jgi:hypothetical protein